MKFYTIAVFCLLFTFLAASCFKQEEIDVSAFPKLSESEIDISDISLSLAREFYPKLDKSKYQQMLSEMVADIKNKTNGIKDPSFRIRVVNRYLFKEKGFKYDFDDPNVENPNNRYLNGILETKKGSCITFPLLYVALGQKLGYPIYPVLAPEHFFVRYSDPSLTQQNIEATSGASEIPDSLYKKDFNISEVGIASGAYLRTLTYKEYVSELLAINAIGQLNMKKELNKALSYVEISLKISSKTPELYRLKGHLLFRLSRTENDPQKALAYTLEADNLLRKAYELGYVKLPREEYLKSIKDKKTASN